MKLDEVPTELNMLVSYMLLSLRKSTYKK